MSESDTTIIVSENNKTLLQIDHTSLITSIAFINICFALIVYLRGNKAPFGEEASKIVIFALALIYTSFLVCAIFTYVDMIGKSYTKINEAITVRNVSYIVGMICFTMVTLILLTQN